MKPSAALSITVLICGAAACSSATVSSRETSPDYQIPPAASGPIPPGRYALPVQGSQGASLPKTVVDVPAGFIADGAFLMLAASDNSPLPAEDPKLTALTVWGVSGVYPDGCHDLDSPRIVKARTAHQMAAVVHRMPGMNVSDPEPSLLDGHPALYLEFTTGDIDYAACNGGSYAFFEADPGTAHVEIPGVLERWWILDLHGTPVVVGTAAGPQTTAAQAATIKAVAESVTFGSN